MKSKTAKICLALLAALGFSVACTEPDMYGSPYNPEGPQDTTVHTMYGIMVSSYIQNDITEP